jgi:predicted neutral ceramidase superfamily lipid hydrolase
MTIFRPVYLVIWIAVAVALVILFNLYPDLPKSPVFLVAFIAVVLGVFQLVVYLRKRKDAP